MSLPTYAKTKDSGVDWLGKVPAHWDIQRLGFYFRERREKVSDKDFEPLSVTMQGIVPRIDTAAKTDDGENRKLVRNGDFVINSRSDRKGSAGVSSLDGSVSLISTVLEPQETVSGSFVHLLLRSVNFQEEYYRYGKGIVADLWSTNYSEMRNIRLAMPPITEQIAIADFLEGETRRIDALVGEQRRLIELLREKRRAVISHAVTKGLNPDAPMKPSGIEWLGDVPDHWNVSRVKHATSKIVDCPHDTPVYSEEGEHLVIRTSDLDSGILYPNQMLRVTEDDYCHRIRREPLFENDIVYSREGGRWGHAALVTQDNKFCLGQRMMQFRVNPKFKSCFLMWHLNSEHVYRQGEVDTVGAASPHVNVSTIINYRIAMPPLPEQEQIVDYVSDRLGDFDTLTAEAQRAIDLLQERRTALISAAVTGKIDVRGLVEAEAA